MKRDIGSILSPGRVRAGLLVGLSLGAAGAALAVGRWLFPLGSINHDDQMYVFSARLLGRGHITLPADFAPLRPWASGVRGGRLVLKYTPAWPAVLELGSRLGSMRLGPAVVAALAVALTGVLGREVFGRWTEGLLAATVLLLSPLFLVQAGTYLPYLLQLVLDLAILVVVLGALRRWSADRPPPRAVTGRLVAGGALWGAACFARQYDAVLLVVPVAIAVIFSMRRHPRRMLVAAAWSTLGAVAPIAALLVLNARLMGSPLRSTFAITGSHDTLGFGMRGVFRTTAFNFKGGDGWVSFEQNLGQLPGWAFGGIVLVVLALLGLWRYRRAGYEIWALVGVAVSFTLGYALFWSPYSIVRLWSGAETMGPFYHLPLLIPLALFSAAGLGVLFDRSRPLGAITMGALLAITLVAIGPKIDRNRAVTRQYEAAQRLVNQAHLGRAVLFMEDRGSNGFESATPFLENRPSLDQPVIYALDDGSNDFAVLERFPDRTPARMRTELRPGDQLQNPTRFIERLQIERGRTITLRFRIVNTVGWPTVVSSLQVGNLERAVVLDTASTRGKTYVVAWTLQTGRLERATSTTVDLRSSSGTINIEAIFSTPRQVSNRYQRQYPFVLEQGDVNVLTPGRGRYLFQYAAPTWLNQNVDPTLSEVH